MPVFIGGKRVMDKPRLIDADKLLNWINTEIELSGGSDPVLNADRWAFRKVKKEVESRRLDPDPIPLPTIKPGDGETFHVKCPKCDRINSCDLWDRATEKMFEPNPVVSIRGTDATTASFICPSCKNESEFCDLEVVE